MTQWLGWVRRKPRIFSEAQPVPPSGVYAANDYMEQVKDIYANGHGRGVSTGIPAIDDLFTVAEGQLSVVTGLPSSGKSEFIDQIMVNLAQKEKWKFAVCSFENPPQLHISKLCEKITGKPFFEGMTPRMTEQEMSDAVGFINDHFVFLESKDGGLSTIDSIIDRIKQAVFRLGCRGAVIDHYNFIEHQGQEEHQSISMMLTKITSFCKAAGIHIWFVAHPAKMYPEDGTYAVPKGMSISGSAAWFAKADLGITASCDNDVEVHCWKSRFKWVGQQGVAKLKYDGSMAHTQASQRLRTFWLTCLLQCKQNSRGRLVRCRLRCRTSTLIWEPMKSTSAIASWWKAGPPEPRLWIRWSLIAT